MFASIQFFTLLADMHFPIHVILLHWILRTVIDIKINVQSISLLFNFKIKFNKKNFLIQNNIIFNDSKHSFKRSKEVLN